MAITNTPPVVSGTKRLKLSSTGDNRVGRTKRLKLNGIGDAVSVGQSGSSCTAQETPCRCRPVGRSLPNSARLAVLSNPILARNTRALGPRSVRGLRFRV